MSTQITLTGNEHPLAEVAAHLEGTYHVPVLIKLVGVILYPPDPGEDSVLVWHCKVVVVDEGGALRGQVLDTIEAQGRL